MLQALPALVSNLEEHRRKTMYGQVGFFDLGADDNAFGFDFEMPDVDEFPKNELPENGKGNDRALSFRTSA